MAEFNRKAGVLWTGDLTGAGLISTESKVIYELPYTYETLLWRSEWVKSGRNLIVAAHASCFSMSVASTLDEEGLYTRSDWKTTATCTMAPQNGGYAITNMRLHVRCEVP